MFSTVLFFALYIVILSIDAFLYYSLTMLLSSILFYVTFFVCFHMRFCLYSFNVCVCVCCPLIRYNYIIATINTLVVWFVLLFLFALIATFNLITWFGFLVWVVGFPHFSLQTTRNIVGLCDFWKHWYTLKFGVGDLFFFYCFVFIWVICFSFQQLVMFVTFKCYICLFFFSSGEFLFFKLFTVYWLQ